MNEIGAMVCDRYAMNGCNKVTVLSKLKTKKLFEHRLH